MCGGKDDGGERKGERGLDLDICPGSPELLVMPLARATTLSDAWDASPPTLGILRTKCIWFPLQLLQLAFLFSLSTVGSRPDRLAKFSGRRKEVQAKGMGDCETWLGQ